MRHDEKLNDEELQFLKMLRSEETILVPGKSGDNERDYFENIILIPYDDLPETSNNELLK